MEGNENGITSEKQSESGESGEKPFLGDEIHIFMRKNRKEYHYVYYAKYENNEWILNKGND
jgi:hypothetical protein